MRLTKEQRQVFVMMGERGGAARSLALSPERRRAIARKGAMARLRNIKFKKEQHQ